MGREKSEERLRLMKGWLSEAEIIGMARKAGDSGSWTRKRKMPFYDIMVSVMGRKGLTAAMELRRYFHEAEKIESAVSKQDYLARRRSLNFEVFQELNRRYLEHYYRNDSLKEWEGYVVMAIDGSRAEVPNSAENRERFGVIENQYGDAVARCNISCLYDILNENFLDISIHHYKVNEIEEAKGQIKRLGGVIGGKKALIIFDRNYPSLDFIDFLEKEGVKYLIRLKSYVYKEERKEMRSADEEVEIKHSGKRLSHIKAVSPERALELKEKLVTKARIIEGGKLGGEGLCLITNIRESISASRIVTLYKKRWGIEKKYHTLKNKMRFESVTGKSSVYVYQDFWAQIMVFNMIHDVMRRAARGLKAKRRDKTYKYETRINENIAIGVFKESFIRLMVTHDEATRSAMYERMVKEIQKNITPVRKSKTNPRRWHYFNKYKCNQKPSF